MKYRNTIALLAAFLEVVSALSFVSAQQTNFGTPVVRASIHHAKIVNESCTRNPNQCIVDIVYQDVSDNDILDTGFRTQWTIPVGAAPAGPCTSSLDLNGNPSYFRARNTARSGETGSEPRIQQFRILGYLFDRGCFTAIGMTTIAP